MKLEYLDLIELVTANLYKLILNIPKLKLSYFKYKLRVLFMETWFKFEFKDYEQMKNIIKTDLFFIGCEFRCPFLSQENSLVFLSTFGYIINDIKFINIIATRENDKTRPYEKLNLIHLSVKEAREAVTVIHI